MDDDEAVGLDREEPHQAGDRAAGLVHVRRRDREDQPRGRAHRPGSDPDPHRVRRRGARPVAPEVEAPASCLRGQLVDDHGADVVPVAGVRRARGFRGPTTSQVPSSRHGRQYCRKARSDGDLAFRHASGAGLRPSSDSALAPSAALALRCLGALRGLGVGSSCSMPASASASASSASSASGGDLLGDVDDQDVAVVDQRRRPPAAQLGGQDLGAGLEALDGDGDVLRDVRRAHLELDGLGVDGDDGLGSGLALGVTGTSTVTFSPLADHDEVDVLDDRLDRVALHVLGQGELARCRRATMLSRAFANLSAIIVSWPGSVMCTGSVPWP